jgi:hypothetical protein
VKRRVPILLTTGVISVLGFGKDPAPIPDEEIEAVKAVLIISGGYLGASCGRLSGKQLRWPVKNPC